MRFEEIADHILNSSNSYEIERGIKTKSVSCYVHSDNCNWAIFIADKSDGTKTLFYARKGERADDDHWHYFCPSKSEAREGFSEFIEYYEQNETENRQSR